MQAQTTLMLQQLADGLELKDGPTLPARCKQIATPQLWARTPPVRERKSVPDSWLELSIREGRNRQIRRMTAGVGYPTLRLIRTQIGDWSLQNLQPGQHQQLAVNTPTRDSGRGTGIRRR